MAELLMQRNTHPSVAAAMSETVLALFRASSSLVVAGDRLVAPLGLTTSRWQVLGTIVAAQRPQPVAWLARDMGAARQNVQRVVNDLMRDGFVAMAPNPHHRRALLVTLTDSGREAFEQAMGLQKPWMERLTGDISIEDVEAMQRVLAALRTRLDAELSTQDLD